jgi:hypothetical protein
MPKATPISTKTLSAMRPNARLVLHLRKWLTSFKHW